VDKWVEPDDSIFVFGDLLQEDSMPSLLPDLNAVSKDVFRLTHGKSFRKSLPRSERRPELI
jgi:hypothetical protein